MNKVRHQRILTVPGALAILCLMAPSSQSHQASSELAALVPKLAAWTPSESVRNYFPDNLFEYINGAAESYLSYDFQELLVVDFEKKGTEATLTLEIYDMGRPLNAFGIFASERYPENKAVTLGDLGYVEGEALNFLCDRYYVKMLAFGLGEATESALIEAAGKVAGATKARGGLPEFVRAFPTDNLVARSEKYIKRNFMGHGFLHDGYVATYKFGERELEGFFVDGGREEEAAEMLTRLLDALAADGQTVEESPLGFHARNRYGQHLYIARIRNILCGAMRVPDGLQASGESLLRAMTAVQSGLRTPK